MQRHYPPVHQEHRFNFLSNVDYDRKYLKGTPNGATEMSASSLFLYSHFLVRGSPDWHLPSESCDITLSATTPFHLTLSERRSRHHREKLQQDYFLPFFQVWCSSFFSCSPLFPGYSQTVILFGIICQMFLLFPICIFYSHSLHQHNQWFSCTMVPSTTYAALSPFIKSYIFVMPAAAVHPFGLRNRSQIHFRPFLTPRNIMEVTSSGQSGLEAFWNLKASRPVWFDWYTLSFLTLQLHRFIFEIAAQLLFALLLFYNLDFVQSLLLFLSHVKLSAIPNTPFGNFGRHSLLS